MYDVTGSLCRIMINLPLTGCFPKVDIGDLIVIHDTGAHGYSMGYNYNGNCAVPSFFLRKTDQYSSYAGLRLRWIISPH